MLLFFGVSLWRAATEPPLVPPVDYSEFYAWKLSRIRTLQLLRSHLICGFQVRPGVGAWGGIMASEAASAKNLPISWGARRASS